LLFFVSLKFFHIFDYNGLAESVKDKGAPWLCAGYLLDENGRNLIKLSYIHMQAKGVSAKSAVLGRWDKKAVSRKNRLTAFLFSGERS